MSVLRIEVDQGDMLSRRFGELEKQNLPSAMIRASNSVAYEIRQTWKRTAGQVFDRPMPMTQNAAQYEKATKAKPYAIIKLRDEALKGTPPARYLFPQVEGGGRGQKGMEKLLERASILPPGMYAVPGKGANLDEFGNIRAGQVRQIISQLQAGREAGYTSNETAQGREKRLKRQRVRGGGGSYFATDKKRGRLPAGIYEHIAFASGNAVRSIFIFVQQVRYKPRYDIFGMAQKRWEELMPFFFDRELEKAVAESKLRGKG